MYLRSAPPGGVGVGPLMSCQVSKGRGGGLGRASGAQTGDPYLSPFC